MRRLLSLLGLVLAGAGLVFVGLRLAAFAPDLVAAASDPARLAALLGLTLLLAAALLLPAFGWGFLLRRFGIARPWRWVLCTCGISQLAKYVPGNVFHYAGRQAIGMAAGLPGPQLAGTQAAEIGIQVVTGGAFALLLLSQFVPAVPEAGAAVAFGLAVALALFLSARLLGADLARAGALHFGFHAVAGTVFVLTAMLVAPGVGDPMLVGSAYVVAWLAGFATPGAPAGLGIREVALLFLLRGVAGEGDLLATLVVHRVLTVLADLLFFLAASALRRPVARTA